jgi:hypothetical protein
LVKLHKSSHKNITYPEDIGGTKSRCGEAGGYGQIVVAAHDGRVVAQYLHLHNTQCKQHIKLLESGNPHSLLNGAARTKDCGLKTNLGLGGVPTGVKNKKERKNINYCR